MASAALAQTKGKEALSGSSGPCVAKITTLSGLLSSISISFIFAIFQNPLANADYAVA
jgi:hypothetical protein